MKVKVRFFSAHRDATGIEEMLAEKRRGATVGELLEDIVKTHPLLKRFKKTTMIAVNREFAELNQVLNDGDEVAFMPPIGGG